MVRSKTLVNLNGEQLSFTFVIFLEFCTSIVAICSGGSLLYHLSSGCTGFRYLGMTLVVIGATLLILSFTNFLLYRKPEISIAKSICCSVPLILALLGLGIFALVVSSKGGGKSIPGQSYKEYRVESYSKWMQNKVEKNWDEYYKKVVVENKGLVCNALADVLGIDHALTSGCCKPPENCNFNNTNPKVWVKPANSNGNYSEDDCNRWDDDPNTLCFNCRSCKAGFLEDVTSHWFFVCIILRVTAIDVTSHHDWM
ncbi:tetraspanin-8-like [Chenopodium quinoa]|uniref:tetraspanin-8-like n=1 Tax=Chenopodium quinoa TaxID=63459 RepID=UPI000B78E8D9|nr:tetraspanin-8-like [Chenopodium quinoa]